MAKLKSIVKNTPGKSTTYVGDDGKTYTLSGDLSMRANNPGNISPVSAKSRAYYEKNFNVIGYTKSSNGPDVAVFATPQDGARAQAALWQSPKYQSMTLQQAAKSWAASPYAPQLAKAAGVSLDTKVSNLTPQQLNAITGTQNTIEGHQQLSITGDDGASIDRSSFFPEEPQSAALSAINDATTQTAPSPLPGRPSALSGPQASGGSTVTLASGKQIATGTYPSSDGSHQVTVTDDGHGNAVVTKLQNPGEIPGVIDPLHENHSVAGTIVHNTIQGMADSGAGQAVQAAVPAVQQAASNATNAFNSAAPGVSSAIGNAFNSGISGLSGLFGGGSPSQAPTQPSLGATGTAMAGTGASGSATPPVNYLSPTTTYTQQPMTSANPDYEKYIAAQGADDIGSGPGTFGDLTSLANSGTPNAFNGPKTVTTTQQVAHPSDAVRQLQGQLGISADGLYGPQTTAAVKSFQQAHGLTVDGIVGPQTLGALNGTATAPVAPPAAPVATPAAPAQPAGNAFVQSVSGGPGRHDSHGWGVNAQGHIVAE